ncbi:cytochrome b/b6 domain-containing protein [Actinoplanes solisilvae]|uniref:cytochrome b/b6 domain-containing protein n=1 Tax=Actinoplanes solisilvae TaxID=2486853 RepID=UPI000FD964D9|nr:cytochrome b/b6 domain-containing protein [Actinoplanes solisilvae]
MTGTVPRFGAVTRAVHWSVAVLMITCIVTAAILYNGSIALAVGHRHLVETVHVYAGFALPAPILLGAFSAAYRQDMRRLNRFLPRDWRWLFSRKRRDGSIKVGKFNAGQKLNGALSGGAIAALLGTGIIMYFPGLTRLSWRTGATFVHDWFALAVGLLVVGHIFYAVNDSEAQRGMLSGRVSESWARADHGAWADELLGPARDGKPEASNDAGVTPT